jgi:hypothetical protein
LKHFREGKDHHYFFHRDLYAFVSVDRRKILSTTLNEAGYLKRAIFGITAVALFLVYRPYWIALPWLGMAATAWGRVERERLLGRIILLQLLNETFEKPSENSINEPNIRDRTSAARVLSLRREKELVEILAFLSASTDDPSKVIAVCVEEGHNGNALVVRMAVNNGGLENVKDGFEKMARVLERAATQGHSLYF